MSPATEWTPDTQRPRTHGDLDLTVLHDPLHTRTPAPWSVTERLALVLLVGCLGAAVGMLYMGW